MGMKRCCRSGCNNIMCSVQVDGRYLCRDCQEELMRCRKLWPAQVARLEAAYRIDDFFRTIVGTYAAPEGGDTEEAFRSFFRYT